MNDEHGSDDKFITIVTYDDWLINEEGLELIENIWDLKQDTKRMEEVPKYTKYKKASWYLAPENPELIDEFLPED